MSTEDNSGIANNGWQNIGICKKYSSENIERKYQLTYLDIVESSFGYGDIYTNRITATKWSEKLSLAKSTFLLHIKHLVDNGHIKINIFNGFIKDGGSKPNSYSPVFPKGYGKIWLKSKDEESKQEFKDKIDNIF